MAFASDGYWISYYKQPRALRLDPGYVAVYQPRSGMAPLARTLAGNPLEQALSGQDGWYSRHAEKKTLAAVAKDLGRFVSPVFLDNFGGPMIVTPQIIVRFNSYVAKEDAERILAVQKVGTILQRNYGQMAGAYLLQTNLADGAAVLDLANRLAALPEIRFAEPNLRFTGQSLQAPPNDPFFNQEWALNNTGQNVNGDVGVSGMDMGALRAWQTTTGDPSIVTVVFDNGIEQSHEDINQVPGRDFMDNAPGGGPANSFDKHGTSVAGVISGRRNNGIGGAGLAPDTRVASGRLFRSTNDSGSWTTFTNTTIDGLAWALSIGARVTNNSNAYGFTLAAIDDAYANAQSKGLVNFAAAGNSGAGSISYPSSCPGVIAIAALKNNGVRASFSQFGPGLDLSAPGQNVFSTDRTGSAGYVNGNYCIVNGTSIASPLAAASAALVLSANRTLDATDVETILDQTARDLGTAGYDTGYGYGFISASAAVAAAAKIKVSGNIVFGDRIGAVPTSVTLEFRSATNGAGPFSPVAIGASGAFTSPAPKKAFRLSVKVGTFLRRTIKVDNTAGESSGLSLGLVNGDVDGNNVVNAGDRDIVLAALNSAPGAANWNPSADLNGDGRVTAKDTDIVRRNLGRVGDE